MSECPCGMPFPTTERCPQCGSAVHVYCMRDTKCKWCLDSSSGKRKAHQVDESMSKKPKSMQLTTARPEAAKKAKTTNGYTEVTRKTLSGSSEASDTESELSESELLISEQESDTPSSDDSLVQVQPLKLLRLKAKVAKYQAKAHELKAKALETEFAAETLATRIKLRARGVSEKEIDSSLPAL